MQLSALLEKLTTLVSKTFALAAFVPIMVFAFLNGVLLYFHSGWFKRWADAQIVKPSVFDTTVIVVGLAVTAYMLASVGLFLREVLEGKRLVPLVPALDRRLRSRQQRRLDDIWERYKEARNNSRRITHPRKLHWQKRLTAAAAHGHREHRGRTLYDPGSVAATKIAELVAKRNAAIPPTYDELADAVALLSAALRTSDEAISPLRSDRFALLFALDVTPGLSREDKRGWQQQLAEAAAEGIGRPNEAAGPYGGNHPVAVAIARIRSRESVPARDDIAALVGRLCALLRVRDESLRPLRDDRFALLDLFDYAQRAWGPLEIRYFNERHAAFGTGYVAPTAMGNVANSMQNYALSRYGLNLETFWSRLQLVVMSKKETYTILQDAKTQLDFLVSCCWLSLLTWIPWAIALPFIETRVWPFLVVALGGPLLTYFFYALATTNYVALAELVSGTVDLYRFSLLQALHIPLPKGSRAERRLWHTLQDLSTFGQEVELSYGVDEKSSEKPPTS